MLPGGDASADLIQHLLFTLDLFFILPIYWLVHHQWLGSKLELHKGFFYVLTAGIGHQTSEFLICGGSLDRLSC